MAMKDTDDLYVETIENFPYPEEKSRFRKLVSSLMSERDFGVSLDPEKDWDSIVKEAVVISRAWIPESERRAILAKMDAMEDEYNDALAAQDIMHGN